MNLLTLQDSFSYLFPKFNVLISGSKLLVINVGECKQNPHIIGEYFDTVSIELEDKLGCLPFSENYHSFQ